MSRKINYSIVVPGLLAMLIVGCENSANGPQSSDGTRSSVSAQTGSGTDTGTSGVSSGEVAPATQPTR